MNISVFDSVASVDFDLSNRDFSMMLFRYFDFSNCYVFNDDAFLIFMSSNFD